MAPKTHTVGAVTDSTTDAAATAPAAATPNPVFGSNRSAMSVGIAPARIANGSNICGESAPQKALATAARHGRSVSQAAIARCMYRPTRTGCAGRNLDTTS